ncbi:MAG: DUF4831 family protein [Bacteroidales bacterium]|nr:DUF4831 family protein [Bacteroidales bacterium]
MRKKWMLLCLVAVSFFSAAAQKAVVKLPVDTTNAFGSDYFIYALPQTAFQIDVVVTQNREVKGIYSDYASKLLGLNNIVTQNRTIYELKSVSVTPVTLPDEDYVYAVELSPAQKKNHFLNKLYENQMVAAKSAEYPSHDFGTQPIPDFFRYYSDLAYMEQENSYVETQIVDGVVRQVPASRVQKVTKTSEQKAQEAADMIDKIRKDRYALLAGEQEVAYQPEALSKMIEELNELEKNYIGLFAGFTVCDEVHYQVVVMPGQSNITPAFSFTAANGFSTEAGKPADTYYLSVVPQYSLEPVATFTGERAKSKKYVEPSGYRIRRPVPSDVALSHGHDVVCSVGTCSVFQFGKIESLPAGNDDFDIAKFVVIY